MGVEVRDLPYKSHTLKPMKAQRAAHAWLDEIVLRNFPNLQLAPDAKPKIPCVSAAQANA